MKKLRDMEVVKASKWQNQTLVAGLWLSMPGYFTIHQLTMIYVNKAVCQNPKVIIGNCRLVIESEVLALTKETGNFTERSDKSQTTVNPLDTGIRRD